MAIRSRHGCIDCKRAKVKCDELHPWCGTCKRRGRQCSGYLDVPKPAKSRDSRPTDGGSQHRALRSIASEISSPLASSTPPGSPTALDVSVYNLRSPATIDVVSTSAPPIRKSLVPIPPGSVNPSDEPFIEAYFLRHPAESVFGPEFIDEMNAMVLKVFQNSPVAVGDTLSAIGEAYLKDSSGDSLVHIPNRRARILQRLRNLDTLGVSLELLLTTMLGLCAVELIDAKDRPRQMTSLPVLLENLSMMLDHHLRRGYDLTQLSKYFLRALARQDMMISLAKFQRPRIPTIYWLDDISSHHADRFMGYTCTLMPLMSDLCALAEDFRHARAITFNTVDDPESSRSFDEMAVLLDRASELKSRIQLWHPTVDSTLSFRSSRQFLLHANAYRSACLLYLHRLVSPAGDTVEADQAALVMAYEIMVHTSGSEDDVKMALWPVFLAACEVSSEADRMTADNMLQVICGSRKTATSFQIRSFVKDRVWDARDNGRDWNWMALSEQYPDENLPI
ncbi:hypothetical protein PV10_04151 [Exophiala mesophila]|uniref:Zn(2)-C6 fungal-type domain-containing protein n=1 Tax=Exophiala mesophila TaxID=212818 RepID=A0A0D1XXD2_EXOME|nr:uncharacterized protein PV10_04151 [Exophiala mesophila]KIV92891.1 hypothetical protein PV10_04151 [Exophiala mesophila]